MSTGQNQPKIRSAQERREAGKAVIALGTFSGDLVVRGCSTSRQLPEAAGFWEEWMGGVVILSAWLVKFAVAPEGLQQWGGVATRPTLTGIVTRYMGPQHCSSLAQLPFHHNGGVAGPR